MPKDTEMVFSVNSKNQLLGFATQVATADNTNFDDHNCTPVPYIRRSEQNKLKKANKVSCKRILVCCCRQLQG